MHLLNDLLELDRQSDVIPKLHANACKEDKGNYQIIKAVLNSEKKNDNSNMTIPQFIYNDHHSFQ